MLKLKNAYTLIEIILMIAILTLGSMGVYTIYNKLSISKKVELETLFILNATEKLDAVYNVSGTFSSLNSAENIKNIGINFNKIGGLEILEEANYSVSTDGQYFNFNYLNLNPEGCVKLLNKLGNSAFSNRFGILINNNIIIQSNSSISNLTSECNRSPSFSVVYNVSGKFQNIPTNPSDINPSLSVSSGINPRIIGPSPSGVGNLISGNLLNIENSPSYSFSNVIFDCITGVRCTGTNTYINSGGSVVIPPIVLEPGTAPDVCPNIPDFQGSIPPNMAKDSLGNCVISCSYPLVLDEATNTCVPMPPECLRPSYIDATGKCVSPPTSKCSPQQVFWQNPIGSSCAAFSIEINEGTSARLWVDTNGTVGDVTVTCQNGSLVKSNANCGFDDNFLPDQCMNIPGNQTVIPNGMTRKPNSSTDCICSATNQTLVNGICVNSGNACVEQGYSGKYFSDSFSQYSVYEGTNRIKEGTIYSSNFGDDQIINGVIYSDSSKLQTNEQIQEWAGPSGTIVFGAGSTTNELTNELTSNGWKKESNLFALRRLGGGSSGGSAGFSKVTVWSCGSDTPPQCKPEETFVNGRCTLNNTIDLAGSSFNYSTVKQNISSGTNGTPNDFILTAPTDYLTKDYPVMINIHGGGWMMGTPSDNTLIDDRLSKRGYKVFSPKYTLAVGGNTSTQMPRQMQDISNFTNWLKSNKNLFGINNSSISIMGGSAGAHLAMYEATKGSAFNYQCLWNIAGPISLSTIVNDLNTVSFPNVETKNNQINFIKGILDTVAPTEIQKVNGNITGTAKANKIFILHSENDFLVPFMQIGKLGWSQAIINKVPYTAPYIENGHNLGVDASVIIVPEIDRIIADSCK